MFSREVFGAGYLFDEELNELEDYDLLFRLSRKHDFYHLDQVTHEFRQFEDFTVDEIRRHLEIYKKIYKRYQAHSTGHKEIAIQQERFLRELEIKIFQREKEQRLFTLPVEPKNDFKPVQGAVT